MLRGMSFLRLLLVMVRGAIKAVIPRIIMVLKMLEPTMFPMAMSALPWNDERKLTTISGVEVPMPTIVSPITNSLSPNFLAMLEEPSTSQLAPSSISDNPASSIRICIVI